MLSNEIVGDERFIEMSAECQILYVFLNMAADDEGFVQPKSVMRQVGAKEESLKILMAKGFVIPLRGQVVVVRHFKLHNHIRKERITPTVFQEEKQRLQLHDSKYYLKIREDLNFTAWNNDILPDNYILSDICPSDVRIDEIRLDKIESSTNEKESTEKGEEIRKEISERLKFGISNAIPA